MVGREGAFLIHAQSVERVEGTCTLREHAAWPLRHGAAWRTCPFSVHVWTVWTADLAAPDDGGNGSAYCAARVGASAHSW